VESNRKPVKKSIVATIVFVVIALLLTFFSKTLYNMNLPSVKYANPSYGALERVFTGDTVLAAKKEYALYAPAEQRVLEVLVKEGDIVRKGEELIRLDASGLENDMLRLELEKQQVKDSKRYLSSNAYRLSM
jgi:multidrug efflux pump subunit AcrA (membrane-fusion protein)